MKITSKILFVAVLIFWLNCKLSDDNNGIAPPTTVYPTIDLSPSWGINDIIVYTHSHITHIDSANGDYQEITDSTGMWFINSNGTNNRMFLQGAEFPDWSPDGEYIVFARNARIWKIKANGDSLTQLTFGRRSFLPKWSLDGSKIVYWQSVSTETHLSGIWIMDADGSADHHVISYGSSPDWSPDCSRIIYEAESESTTPGKQIWIADTNGMHQNQLTFFDSLCCASPTFSPDGSQIAFGAATESNVWIYTMDAQGCNFEVLIENGILPSWSPDGSQIVYVGWTDKSYDPQNNGVLYIVNADGTDKKQLTFGPQP